MVLFDNVVQIFDLAHLRGRFPFGVDGSQCGQIGIAFVYGDGLRFAVLIDGFLDVTTRGSLVTIARSRKSTVFPALSTARTAKITSSG
ncbi:hypothetical protein OKW38_000089 [Paraburkholderia sp. MM5496-R1]